MPIEIENSNLIENMNKFESILIKIVKYPSILEHTFVYLNKNFQLFHLILYSVILQGWILMNEINHQVDQFDAKMFLLI